MLGLVLGKTLGKVLEAEDGVTLAVAVRDLVGERDINSVALLLGPLLGSSLGDELGIMLGNLLGDKLGIMLGVWLRDEVSRTLGL